jgi:FeS assembly SUF system regulator
MIRLTKISDYGFVILTYITYQGPGKTYTARDVAKATGLPLPMVSKILKIMTRGNLLASHRGTKGGYSLARPAEAITATEIIGALEGPISITECLTHSPSSCQVESLCPVRFSWQRINDAMVEALDGITLAELVWPKRRAAETSQAATVETAPMA